jgi:chaperonin GroEL (HSP60 family)
MTRTEIVQVETIAANGNEKIGSLLADAFKAVGKDSVIALRTIRHSSTRWSSRVG